MLDTYFRFLGRVLQELCKCRFVFRTAHHLPDDLRFATAHFGSAEDDAFSLVLQGYMLTIHHQEMVEICIDERRRIP